MTTATSYGNTCTTSVGSWTFLWVEVERMLDDGEVIEEHPFDDLTVKYVRLLPDWRQPLHLVYVLDHERRLVVFRTLYVPDLSHWYPGYRERRKRHEVRDV